MPDLRTSHTHVLQAEGRLGAGALHAGRVLIIDDEASVRKALTQIIQLRLPGIEVETVGRAQEALARIAEKDFDAIISDIRMPEMDGLTLLSEIRSRRPDTPILLITGYDSRDLVLKALRLGAFDFIQKPPELEYFIAAVARALRMRHLTRKVQEQQGALAKSREDLRALAAQLITVQEEERRRLARELHDDLNQQLIVLLLNIEALQRHAPPAADATATKLQSLRDQIAGLSEDVRRLSHQLHPAILDHFGLAVAVETCVDDFAKREQMPVTFKHQDLPECIPTDIATCLYRVTQEGLRNVAKHARASRAGVRLRYVREAFLLSVWDSGVGFDVELSQQRRGLGLISVRERVRLVNGRFAVRSSPGAGTFLLVKVPLPAGASGGTEPI